MAGEVEAASGVIDVTFDDVDVVDVGSMILRDLPIDLLSFGVVVVCLARFNSMLPPGSFSANLIA